MNVNAILILYPEYNNVGGPFLRKDGRKHVILYGYKKRRTVSYPKILMEIELGRRLTDNETVDHIDENKQNDSIDNLQILSREENARKSSILRPAKMFHFICPECGAESSKELHRVKSNIMNKGTVGPFCSRSCAGKHNARARNY